jgi:peptidyl-tRNA hydrolase, PTH1 family
VSHYQGIRIVRLIVGLGNPGTRYAGTRHNIGFEVLRELAERNDSPRPTLKYDAELVELNIGSEKVLLLAPQTYMNESGRSVRQCVDFYQIDPDHIAIVCDDKDLEVGRLRWRRAGSSGGQKGLGDILNRLGTTDIPRLRIGIGYPPQGWETADYVLSRFRSDELEEVKRATLTAADSLEDWVRDGIDACMNKYNAAD